MRTATTVLALLACAGAITSTPMTAQATAGSAGASPPDARSRYEQERAACLSGQSGQERSSCLREAAAARAEAGRGGTAGENAAAYARNARLRCERLPAEQRDDCLARMEGQGTTSGSVAGGGILRELVTVEIGARPEAAEPGSAPASAPVR